MAPSGVDGRRLRAPGARADRRRPKVSVRRALRRAARSAATSPRTRACWPDRRRRRPRAVEPRHDQPARRPGGDCSAARVPRRSCAGSPFMQALEHAAGGAAAGELHGGLDALRRGRHALPVPGADWRQRRPTSSLQDRCAATSPSTSGSSTTPSPAVGARRTAAPARQARLRAGLLGRARRRPVAADDTRGRSRRPWSCAAPRCRGAQTAASWPVRCVAAAAKTCRGTLAVRAGPRRGTRAFSLPRAAPAADAAPGPPRAPARAPTSSGAAARRAPTIAPHLVAGACAAGLGDAASGRRRRHRRRGRQAGHDHGRRTWARRCGVSVRIVVIGELQRGPRRRAERSAARRFTDLRTRCAGSSGLRVGYPRRRAAVLLHARRPRLVRARVRGADARPGAGLAGDRHRRARAHLARRPGAARRSPPSCGALDRLAAIRAGASSARAWSTSRR